jgi:hypothetical protein
MFVGKVKLMDVGKPTSYVGGQKTMFMMYVKEGKRTRPAPPPSVPPKFLHSPPPDPTEGGHGGGRVVYILSYYMQLTQPHMLRVPPFLESSG